MNGEDATRTLGESARPGGATLAIGLIVAAVFVFSSYNALGKWLAADYSPWQIMFFRGFFGFLPFGLFVLVARRYEAIRSTQPRMQVTRALLGFGANLCFIFAYREMPLADAVAVGYSAPIFIVILSVPLLSERLGWRRASATLAGFAGILMITRPGSGVFDVGTLYALAGTLCYALMVIATRRLGRSDHTLCTVLYSNGIYALVCALLLPEVWVTPSPADAALLVATGLLGGVGMMLFVYAYRHAEAGVLAPFDYTAMLWAVLFGYLVWQEVPEPLSVVGMAIIAGTGLFLMRHERLRRLRPDKY